MPKSPSRQCSPPRRLFFPGASLRGSSPNDFMSVQSALEKAGFKPELAEITMKPVTETAMSGDDGAKMQRLLEALEGLDDVQDVYTTAVIDE